jgi:hypothetical protein
MDTKKYSRRYFEVGLGQARQYCLGSKNDSIKSDLMKSKMAAKKRYSQR